MKSSPSSQRIRQNQPTSKHKHTVSTDFRQILSKQHSRHFHLIDHPDLVFQLAHHNFDTSQTQEKQHKSKTSVQKRNFHRHKSQQEIIHTQNSFQNLLATKNNASQIFNKNTSDSFPNSKNNSQLISKQIRMKKIDFIKEKPKMNRQIQISKITSNTSPTQKQNLHTKILSINRPIDLFSKQNQEKQTLSNKVTWKQNFQRKKYAQLKGNLEVLIKQIEDCQDLKFSEVFQYEQVILRDYLSNLAIEMKKECMQKGQLIEMIWNSFLALINKVMKVIVDEKKSVQKSQIQQQINLHSSYQQMYLFETKKIKQLGKKYNDSINVIDTLIYELRYKRKQVRKLSKNLAICNDKLNEYKVQHIDLQNQHIDLLIDAKRINHQEAIEVLKRKLQINRLKYLRQKVGLNKKKLKFLIEEQIQYEKLNPKEEELFKKELFQKINSNANKKRKKTNNLENKTKEQTNVIQEFIEKFSTKCIDPVPEQDQIQPINIIRKQLKAHTAINTESNFGFKTEQIHQSTQTSISDKIQFDIISTISTQTPTTQKIKKVETVAIQADGDQMKILLTKARMMVYKTLDLSFYFDVHKDSHRRSAFLLKKQSLKNSLISQIQSDDSESKQKSKRDSKNFKKSSLSKKSSLLNYSNFRQGNNKLENGKNTAQSKKSQKRSTQTLNIQHINTQESEFYKRTNTSKKRTYQSPSGFQQKMASRASVCISNIDDISNKVFLNEQRQKFIENFVMGKEQQFQFIQQNAVMQTYKNFLKEKQSNILLNLFNYKGKERSSFNQPNQKWKDDSNSQDSNEQNQQFSHKKQSKLDAIIEGQNKISSKRNSIRGSGFLSSSLRKTKDLNFQTEKKQFKQELFLSKIIEFTVKKSLIKRKLDASNFIQCKQKSQFVSITQKLAPFMLDIEYLMNLNFNRKKKQNLINIKSVNKLIMMTYSRSIDKMYRNNYLIQNLIKPLFECFQMIYGALKPHQIYKKIVSAISDVLSLKQKENYKEFIFFLGMQKQNQCTPYLTAFDVCLYLKLLDRLNLGGKFGTQIDNLFTSKNKVTAQLGKILQSQNLSHEVIFAIESKIISTLNKLQDYVRESADSDRQSKINLFKVSKMIIQEIIRLRMNALCQIQKFMPFYQKSNKKDTGETQKQKNRIDFLDCEKVKTVIYCCRIPTKKKLYFNKTLEELSKSQKNGRKIVKKGQLGILLIRIGLFDFSEVKQRINQIFRGNFQQKENDQERYLCLGIQKLQRVETESNCILHGLLGEIETLYGLSLIKDLSILQNH